MPEIECLSEQTALESTERVPDHLEPEDSLPNAELEGGVGEGWLMVGFAGFGTVVGFLAGASNQDGVSQTLMTTLFGFVAGGALSLIGFVYKALGRPALRARVTGKALAGLALGVWLGLGVGIYGRIAFEREESARALVETVKEQKRVLEQQEAAAKVWADAERQSVKAAADEQARMLMAQSAERDRALKAWAAVVKELAAAGVSREVPWDETPTQPSVVVREAQRPAGVDATMGVATKSTLLHSDSPSCSRARASYEKRIASGYYERNPGARAADEQGLATCSP